MVLPTEGDVFDQGSLATPPLQLLIQQEVQVVETPGALRWRLICSRCPNSWLWLAHSLGLQEPPNTLRECRACAMPNSEQQQARKLWKLGLAANLCKGSGKKGKDKEKGKEKDKGKSKGKSKDVFGMGKGEHKGEVVVNSTEQLTMDCEHEGNKDEVGVDTSKG